MNTKTIATSLALICAASFLACAQANEEDPAPTEPVETTYDSGTPDTASDTGAADTTADTTPTPDAAWLCTYPATETKACGACGTQSRFCLPSNQWTGWTDCAGEKADVECKVGEKRTSDCGNCGKATDFCDTATCTWVSGMCTGEGDCAPGDEETTTASCTDPTQLRTRTCSDSCKWSTFSACAAPKGWLPMESLPLGGRAFHTAVWTGSRMLIWGGASASTTYKNDGASYDLVANKWTTIASSPLSARRQQAGVWTGSQLFIWGGYNGNPMKGGALYDPTTNAWTAIPDGPLSARHSAVAAWSPATKEVLVWGGCTSGYCTGVAGDGAAYNVETNTWTALGASPLAARADAAYGMVKGELVIWGGRSGSTTMLTDGARFDPVSRAWTKFSAPAATTLDGRYDEAFLVANDSLFIWGGRSTSDEETAKPNGAIYAPMVGFTPIPAASDSLFAPSASRFNVAAWFGGGKLYLFSGIPSTASDVPKEGFVSYEPATDTWKTESVTGVPGNRSRASAVWTGKEALILGGLNGNTSGTYYSTGAIYRP